MIYGGNKWGSGEFWMGLVIGKGEGMVMRIWDEIYLV